MERENLGELSPFLKKIQNLIEPPGKVLDFGVGYGRDAIPLAKLGFNIIGIDQSRKWIKQLEKEVKKSDLSVRAVYGDITKFNPSDEFKLVLANMSLQFMKNKNEVKRVVEKMKNGVKVGGYNAIAVPTKTKPAIKFPSPLEDVNELKELYNDWEIIESGEEEKVFSNGLDGSYAWILAKKI